MTYIPSARVSGTVSTANSNASLSTSGWNLRTGNVVSATSTTIILDGATVADNLYVGRVIEITNGTGASRAYTIASHVDKSCTVAQYIEVIPDTTSTYVIHSVSGTCVSQTQSNTFKTLKIDGNAQVIDTLYTNGFVKILSGPGFGHLYRITGYSGSDKLIFLDRNLDEEVTTDSLYAVFGEYGTAQSGSTTTIILEAAHGHSTVDDFYNNFYVEALSGTGSGQVAKITDYIGSTLTCTIETVSTAFDGTTVYSIFSGWGGTFEDCKDYSQSTVALISSGGQNTVIYQQLGLTNDNTQNRGKYVQNTAVTPSSVHTLVVVSNYFKIKLIGLGTPITGSFQTLFHNAKNKALTSFVDEPINDSNDCELTRSVMVGKTSTSQYRNLKSTDQGNLAVALTNPISAFGELSTIQTVPQVQINFPYYKNENIITEFKNSAFIAEMVTQGAGGIAQLQYVYSPDGSSITTGEYFTVDSTSVSYYVWFNIDSGGSDPTPGGTAIEVAVSGNDNSSTVATAIASAIDGTGTLTSSVLLGNLLSITDTVTGAASGINPGTMSLESTSAVTYNKSESTLSVTNESGVGTYSFLRSKRGHSYRPGQGALGRFTAVFDTPTVGQQQIAGMGNQVSGLFFGVNPDDGLFGILHRSSGLTEIQTLTIAGSVESGAAIATITLDGINFEVALTAGSFQHTAFEIATAVNGSISIFKAGRWIAEQIDDTVVFLSEVVTGPRNTNLYAYSSSSGNTTGEFVQTTEGIAVTNTWISQTNWNISKLNGYGDTTMHLNPTKGNVYQIQFQWLGYGGIVFSIEDNNTQQLIPVHVIKYANKHTIPSISQPSLKLVWGVNTTTSSSAITMKLASGAIFNEGIDKRFDNIFTRTSTSFDIGPGSIVHAHLITFKSSHSFNGKGNGIESRPISLTVATSGTSSVTSVLRIYSNSVLTDSNYQYANQFQTPVIYSEGTTSVTNGADSGTLIYSRTLSQNSIVEINLDTFSNLLLSQNESLSFTLNNLDTEGGGKTLLGSVALVWQDVQ
jgi:hypothetical protein